MILWEHVKACSKVIKLLRYIFLQNLKVWTRYEGQKGVLMQVVVVRKNLLGSWHTICKGFVAWIHRYPVTEAGPCDMGDSREHMGEQWHEDIKYVELHLRASINYLNVLNVGRVQTSGEVQIFVSKWSLQLKSELIEIDLEKKVRDDYNIWSWNIFGEEKSLSNYILLSSIFQKYLWLPDIDIEFKSALNLSYISEKITPQE